MNQGRPEEIRKMKDLLSEVERLRDGLSAIIEAADELRKASGSQAQAAASIAFWVEVNRQRNVIVANNTKL